MKQQLEKEKKSDHPSTGVHLQTQVDKGNTSLEFSLVNEKAKFVAEKLELETQQIALKEEIDVLNNKVENFMKRNEDLHLELSQSKNELQYTKESMEKEKKDALNALALVETEKATLVMKLQLDLQMAEAVKRELQEINDAATTRIKKLESDSEQKEEIITQYFQELKQKEQLQSSLFGHDGKDRVDTEQLNSQLKSENVSKMCSTMH